MEEWKLETLCDLYDTLSIAQAVIFCNTRRKVCYVASLIVVVNFLVARYIFVLILLMLCMKKLMTIKSALFVNPRSMFVKYSDFGIIQFSDKAPYKVYTP